MIVHSALIDFLYSRGSCELNTIVKKKPSL